MSKEIADTKHLAVDAQAEVERLQSSMGQLNNRLRATEEEAMTLQSELARAQTEVLQLKRESETKTEAYRHALRELRGRSLGFVRTRITPLIEEALDALGGDPPYADVALHRLQSLKIRAAEEDTWLARSE
jgi:chromosome segregation ATPase